MRMPKKSDARVSKGSATMQARIRVAARYLSGSTPDASMASICSVTRMEPSSAPIPAPTRPLAIRPVMIGPVSLIREKTITAGNRDLAPNRLRLSRVCSDRTTPVAAPASATSGRDLAPIASS